MLSLTRGANTTLEGAAQQLHVTWSSQDDRTLDLFAVVVGPDLQVTSDQDLVFFNAPTHDSGAVGLTASIPGSTSLWVQLDRMPAAADRVMVAVASDDGPVTEFDDLVASVTNAALVRLSDVERVDVLVVGEFYRRADRWKFRAIGQGYLGGLAEWVRHHGIAVDHEGEDAASSAAPPAPEPPRLTTTPFDVPAHQPQHTGDSAFPGGRPPGLPQWAPAASVPSVHPDLTRHRNDCHRCGERMKRQNLGLGRLECRQCAQHDAQVAFERQQRLQQWCMHIERILPTATPADMAAHWAALRRMDVAEQLAERALRGIAISHMAANLGVAFADGVIEQSEVDEFDRWADALRVASESEVTGMRGRMTRARAVSEISNGRLPCIDTALTLGAGEMAHLDTGALFLRQLASGLRTHAGRLVVSNLKIGFSGETGHEYGWSKVLAARSSGNRLIVSTTLSKGDHVYQVEDAEMAAAVATGANRVAKRLVVNESARDTRRIPQAVKLAVWSRDGAACVQCRRSEYLEFDHIIPWSSGGATSVDNLQLLCRGCNQAKGARI